MTSTTGKVPLNKQPIAVLSTCTNLCPVRSNCFKTREEFFARQLKITTRTHRIALSSLGTASDEPRGRNRQGRAPVICQRVHWAPLGPINQAGRIRRGGGGQRPSHKSKRPQVSRQCIILKTFLFNGKRGRLLSSEMLMYSGRRYQSFGRHFCLHLQGKYYILKTEVRVSLGNFVNLYRTPLLRISEDSLLHNLSREKVQSQHETGRLLSYGM